MSVGGDDNQNNGMKRCWYILVSTHSVDKWRKRPKHSLVVSCPCLRSGLGPIVARDQRDVFIRHTSAIVTYSLFISL